MKISVFQMIFDKHAESDLRMKIALKNGDEYRITPSHTDMYVIEDEKKETPTVITLEDGKMTSYIEAEQIASVDICKEG